jgi:hypothetical protein
MQSMPRDLAPEEKRQWLIHYMNELDETKRSIRAQIREKSNNYHGKKDREFFAWLRRAKSKVSHLIAEREECRQMLGAIKGQTIRRNRVVNEARRHGPTFAECFYASAQEILPQEMLSEIELKALELSDRR